MIKTKHWFKPRGYIHFDLPISKKSAIKITSNSSKVARHSFYPFISHVNKTQKVHTEKNSYKIKRKIKSRPISYSSHVDSAIYSYYSKILSENYERIIKIRNLDRVVTAFRSLGKSNIDFANDVFLEIKERQVCSVVCLDISGFFDNIDHEYLKKMWISILDNEVLPDDHYSVYKSITKYSKVNRDDVYSELGISKNNPKANRQRICTATEFRSRIRGKGMIMKNTSGIGIPQGSPISAILSNIYMVDFDEKINSYMEKNNGSYYRYCDDMIFIIDPEYKDEMEAFVKKEIEKIKTPINESKTEKASFQIIKGVQVSDKPLQYLGFMYDGEKILLRSSALSKFSAKMKGGVKLAKNTRKKHNIIRIKSGLPAKRLYKRKIYEQYSHLGSQNFLSYGYRAANKMDSKHIKKQLKPLWKRLQDEMGDN